MTSQGTRQRTRLLILLSLLAIAGVCRFSPPASRWCCGVLGAIKHGWGHAPCQAAELDANKKPLGSLIPGAVVLMLDLPHTPPQCLEPLGNKLEEFHGAQTSARGIDRVRPWRKAIEV